ncbi:MAG: DUF1499 domain-containing protein [Burkholderiaceae bacterium]|nr:DUF1499 domain-containing protein [Rhodoferax sp.]MCP5283391.1 DUF1499 domain-containing protein [Burkholderiaceae bacterium]
MRWSSIALTVAAALPALVLAAGQAGLLAGQMPEDLGVVDGRLKAPSRTPNSVSSQFALWPGSAHRELAEVAPLPLRGDGPATLARLQRIVQAMPGGAVVTLRDDYLYARFTSRWLGFVDDTEFWVDPQAQVVQVRSASRVGRRDFGVNRARVEAIRAALAAAP